VPSASVEEQVAASRALLAAGDVGAALVGLAGAYEAARGRGRWSAAAWAATWIGHVQEHDVGDLAAALDWFGAAERAAANSRAALPRTRATAAFNAGLVQERRGRTTAARDHYRTAAEAAASAGDPGLVARCAERAGDTLADLGRFSEARTELERAAAQAETAGLTELADRCRAQARFDEEMMTAPPDAHFDWVARVGIERCLATVEQVTPSRLLDAGCGWGGGLLAMAGRWPAARLVGVDCADGTEAIRLPRSIRPRVELRKADLSGPVPGLSGFDVVVCHAVLHTLDDIAPLLATLAGAVRPGGEVVGACFTDAYYRGIRARLAQAGEAIARPEVRLTDGQIETALAVAGFCQVETWPEEVEIQVEAPGAVAHLERLVGRPLDAGDGERLAACPARPLQLDLSPLSFHAVRVDRAR
jgi:SAM-dependent methyltransferase